MLTPREPAPVVTTAEDNARLVPTPPGPPAVADLVDSIIQQALARRASDIHLEPNEYGLAVRFRVDGLLQTASLLPAETRAAVTSRIKRLGSLDDGVTGTPQDGRFMIRDKTRPVDIRVSTMPSFHGETVVMRLLDVQNAAVPLAALGLESAQLREMRRLIRRRQGLILVTGPAGSGKTSTLYACLNDIARDSISVVTVEDPIEYELAGVTQVAVNEQAGLGFASCLRSVLRQDPDVIMVGDVRDQETARVAMQAALTGHLVLAAVHTNDALGAITRLLDMETPPYLIASSLMAVLAQRLVRVLCPVCKTSGPLDPGVREMLGLDDAVRFHRAPGCDFCHGAGAAGRTGIFELLTVTPSLRQLISARAGEAQLRQAARTAGVTALFDDGLRKVVKGAVAYEELLRIAEADHASDA